MPYIADKNRYTTMTFRRCGRSGIRLPLVSLGLWQNFGGEGTYENARAMARTAFDLGVTHFDLANNYGPPPGSAEEAFGRILRDDLRPYRNELIISTKAGFTMWEGPYGDWGSRKYLSASLDDSLRRMGLDYVDIFYSHRPDPETPLEETMGALAQAVRSGKALYAGISNYPADTARRAAVILREMGTPCLIHQPRYHMFERTIEKGLLDVCAEEGIGIMAYMPLAQGLLTNKYLHGIPADSRASAGRTSLKTDSITGETLEKIRALQQLALERGQSLAQMAIAWTLRDERVSSSLIGASRPEQITENIAAIAKLDFSAEELGEIDRILGSEGK
ncbi:aldo/keto reductase [Breznakiella homolactica]|uniref:Aldo/keto reductase n=1 Tax=Breznakiella homolactica TaxID=2798577 RepID=A0A7T8B9L8_9SPIR|nr:aldo/keto reductase [Breznakiella homolactica]QQO09754.1 aldo/keto reductase [Breznakiella homolactica]